MNLSKLGDRGRTEEPGVLQSMGSQRARYDLVTEQQQKYSRTEGLTSVRR